MSRGFPSMTALLGLLAIAGYQNRDKIAEMLGGLGQSKPGAAGQSGIGGLLGQLSSSLGGASAGGVLSGGLGELMERFKQSGDCEACNARQQRAFWLHPDNHPRDCRCVCRILAGSSPGVVRSWRRGRSGRRGRRSRNRSADLGCCNGAAKFRSNLMISQEAVAESAVTRYSEARTL